MKVTIGHLVEALKAPLLIPKNIITSEFKNAVRQALKKSKTIPSNGAINGRIVNYGPTSSAMGQLVSIFK